MSINWEEGTPERCIDLCLVIYMEDYEFARFDGEFWQICFYDDRGHYWQPAQEPIKFYATLNKPHTV